jgi:pentatricopeptide repeat protein
MEISATTRNRVLQCNEKSCVALMAGFVFCLVFIIACLQCSCDFDIKRHFIQSRLSVSYEYKSTTFHRLDLKKVSKTCKVATSTNGTTDILAFDRRKMCINLRNNPVSRFPTHILRGGAEVSHPKHTNQEHAELADLSPPHKRSRLAVDPEDVSNCEESTEDMPTDDDDSSALCPACGQLIPHAHTNCSASDTISNISMHGHSLEPFVHDFFASINDLPITVDAYNVLLQHCSDQKKITTSLAIYERMKNESIAPSFETCDILLSLCESAQEWDLAVRIAQDLIATGLCADERTYNWIIKLCAKLKEWDIVLELYDEMIHSRMDPCSKTRTLAVQACQGQGLWRRALDEFNELRKHTPAASLPYSYVIEACSQAGQVQEAQKLIEEHEAQQSQYLDEHDVVPGAESEDSRVVRLQDSCGEAAESGEGGEDGRPGADEGPEGAYQDSVEEDSQ